MISLKDFKGDYSIKDYNKQFEKEDLKNFLSNLSTESKFEDNQWVLDRLSVNKSISKSESIIYFNQIQDEFKNITKYFALLRLVNRMSIKTTYTNITGLVLFFNYLKDRKINLNKLTKKNINLYKDYLSGLDIGNRTKETYWSAIMMFFKYMSEWEETPDNQIIEYNSNPFGIYRSKNVIKDKYIDNYVIEQLDRIFKKEEIPLSYKTLYWICRLIPSRIMEVCSMNIDCLKPYINERVLLIPMFKQNGGYIEGENRKIAISERDEISRFLLDLINKQKDLSISLQDKLKHEEKGFLFTSINYSLNKKDGIIPLDKVERINSTKWNRVLKYICDYYNIKDKQGNKVKITSHQFRHNAITDRLYEGFRIIDIMSMTNHKSESMIVNSYLHINEEKLEEKQRNVLGEEQTEVSFKGKIVNDNEERILRKPFAHKLGKIGICSDISNCKSNMFKCLECKSFVPNVDELEYFQEQVLQWEQKVNKFNRNSPLYENALYNLKVNKSIVEKIINILEKDK